MPAMSGIRAALRSRLGVKLLAAASAPVFTAGAELQLIQMSVGVDGPMPDGYVTPLLEGDTCRKMVLAMRMGIEENPDWFAPLTKNSSFDDFQRHAALLSDACPVPREARALEIKP